MRWFVRQCIKRGRVSSSILYYESEICDCTLKILSDELNLKRNFSEVIEAYMNYRNKHLEIIEKEYEKKINDYRDRDEGRKV